MSVQLRNDLITECYGDLAVAMAELLGTNDATWVTIGQWASSSIGGYLRLPIPVLGRMIARAFGDGNRDVFADVGRAHTVFLATVGPAAQTTDGDERVAAIEEAWQECEQQLRHRLVAPPGRPGAGASSFWEATTDPRLHPDRHDYNELLVRGFRAYTDALTATSAEERSRSILLGNSLLAVHEQKLLSLAISVGFRSWLRTLTTAWRPFQTRRQWRNQPPGDFRLRLEQWWIKTATKHFVTVDLPGHRVKVGQPLPRTDVQIEVERCVVDEDDVYACSSTDMLSMLFEQFEVDGQPAKSWNALSDRMAYILGLFASAQRSPVWFDENGVMNRPPMKKGFERLLEHRLSTMGLPEPQPGAVDPELAETLETLRGRASHPMVPGARNLSFSSLAASEDSDTFFSELDADIAERLAAISAPGGLLDPPTCRAARDLFSRSSTLLFLGLLFRSLVDGFAAAEGVKVLGAASDLARDPFRRSGETAQFVQDLLGADDGWHDGTLEVGGAAYRSIRGVRGIHALVAGQLLNNGWDTEEFGWPVNQEDVLGTALSFAVPVLEMLDDLGLAPTDTERDTYTRFWLGIGHLLGAPLDALTTEGPTGRVPLTYVEAKALADTIRRRHHHRSLDGVRLTEALVEGMSDGFPRPLDWLAPGLMHAIGDDRVTRLLLVGQGRGRRRSAAVAKVLKGLLGNRLTAVPTRTLVQWMGNICLKPFYEEGAGRPYRRPKNLAESRDTRPAVGLVATDLWPIG